MLKVYTKRGDSGETDLYGGTKVSKDDCRVECYGTMDEANSAIGLAYSLAKDGDLKTALRQIQKRLFVMGAELASDENGRTKLRDRISEADVDFLERLIDGYQAEVVPRDGFLIPGGTCASAALHVARTVARRFERRLIRLKEKAPVSGEILKYANRMSDALFIMAQAEEERALIREIKKRVMGKLKVNDCADFSLPVIKKLAEAAEQKAADMGVPIVFAAADQGGNLVLLHRMENSLLASIDIAINKAYTSVALKMPTDELYGMAAPGGSLYGITATNDSRIIAFGGGFPVFKDGVAIGAIGVSGGSVEEDMEIAKYALSIL
jgi:ATP:cob(I)alamin adenosyltransferase